MLVDFFWLFPSSLLSFLVQWKIQTFSNWFVFSNSRDLPSANLMSSVRLTNSASMLSIFLCFSVSSFSAVFSATDKSMTCCAFSPFRLKMKSTVKTTELMSAVTEAPYIKNQYSRSVTLWYGSDPYHKITDPAPDVALFFSKNDIPSKSKKQKT